MRIPTMALALACCVLLPSTSAQRRKQLTDLNFESITQASTGHTTGVWLINFCSQKACRDLAPAWEELGKELLQQQLFVSSVDVHSNPVLAQRFGISKLPTILLFRDRKMYRFEGKLIPGTTDYTAVLKAFATEKYASGPALDVPPEAGALDWLFKLAQEKLATVKAALEKQDMKGLALAVLPLLLIVLLGIAVLLVRLGNRGEKAKRA